MGVVGCGCNHAQKTSEDSGPIVLEGPSPAPGGGDAAGTVSSSSPAPPRPARPRCRAIAVEGAATIDAESAAQAKPLAVDDEVPDRAWVTLGDGARFVAKDPRTARETTFVGPARARACVDNIEESWVGSGTFESVGGAGESPGAEEWVVTASAVVRYASSRLRLEVHSGETRITVSGGVAWLWPTHATELSEGWQRLKEGQTISARTEEAPIDAARSSVDRCVAFAHSARTLAYALLSPPNDAASGEGGTAADAVKEQVKTKRLARAACAMAALRLGEESAARDGGASGGRLDTGVISALAVKLADADAAWRALPLAQGH
jgi:hypothetical protein